MNGYMIDLSIYVEAEDSDMAVDEIADVLVGYDISVNGTREV